MPKSLVRILMALIVTGPVLALRSAAGQKIQLKDAAPDAVMIQAIVQPALPFRSPLDPSLAAELDRAVPVERAIPFGSPQGKPVAEVLQEMGYDPKTAEVLAPFFPPEWVARFWEDDLELDARLKRFEMAAAMRREIADQISVRTGRIHRYENEEKEFRRRVVAAEALIEERPVPNASAERYISFFSRLRGAFEPLGPDERDDVLKFFTWISLSDYFQAVAHEDSHELRSIKISNVGNSLAALIADPPKLRAYLWRFTFLVEKGVFRRPDIAAIWAAQPGKLLIAFDSDESVMKFLIFAGLINEGYLTPDEFIAQAAPHLRSVQNLGELSDKTRMALSAEARAFFEVLGGRDTFQEAWHNDALGLSSVPFGGPPEVADYEMNKISPRLTMTSARLAAGVLASVIGPLAIRRLWTNHPSQLMNILTFIHGNVRSGEDAEAGFNRVFEEIADFHFAAETGQTPAQFLRDVIARWPALEPDSWTVHPMGLEIELLGSEIVRRFGLAGPLPGAQLNNRMVNPMMEKLILFLMLMGNGIQAEAGFGLTLGTPNHRALELTPSIFGTHEEASRYLQALQRLGLLGQSPMDINTVLPEETPLEPLRRFQFVKHLLYTSGYRLKMFGDILGGDNYASIRVRRDFRGAGSRLQDRRFEDRMNGMLNDQVEFIYAPLLRYHQLLWEASLRMAEEPAIRAIMAEFEASLREWFATVLIEGRIAHEQRPAVDWARDWLARQTWAQPALLSMLDAGQIGLAMAAIDIGYPEDKSEFIAFKGTVDCHPEWRRNLHALVDHILLKLEPLLQRPLQSAA